MTTPVLVPQFAEAMGTLNVPPRGLEEALRSVLLERARQAEQWGGPAHDDEHTLAEWKGFILDHVGEVDHGLGAPIGEARRRLVNVAALALAALEAIDRRYPRGCP